MRLAACAIVAALLAGSAAAVSFTQPAYPIRPGVKTDMITNQRVIASTLQGVINLPSLLLNGTFQVNPLGKPTDKVEVKDVGCLDTIIPPPLNWGPLCPT
ncbi:hypothetical protein MNEG_10417 [Monoraphidium neglectum]|uniref:Uncharacterized protein n=1 Tax=Monoraphidium neglectum TaxID=145388 RepID=A0A0D2M945_9CHLO|nr:hypothetical protein MNEG_10417 [Monoraphidium neglectum]KIY97546.1 hypothetical protein MNEG_10417 [Monoraphidium neglectum]|eukprot:XP_013896566.1 hypothetical protein MNEG_10417 [Monoraphidium neglectum]